MTPAEIKKIVLKNFTWEPWLKRPFGAFIMSNFKGGNSQRAFKMIGLSGWEYVYMFNNGRWYQSQEVYTNAKSKVEKWLKKHSICEITGKMERLYSDGKKQIKNLVKNPNQNSKNKLKKVHDILSRVTTNIWCVHMLEEVLMPQLQINTSKYIKGDVDKFIGDASYPKKKNALEKMEDEVEAGVDFQMLASKYGWMRGRDGFSDPYTAKEIAEHAKSVKNKIVHQYPKIPKQLQKLFSEARELVYFRTRRTDILYEFLFLARPIFREVAKEYHIPFDELRYYTIQSLAEGRPRKYPKDFSCIGYGDDEVFFDKPIFSVEEVKKTKEIKGAIAQMGIVRGKARVIMNVGELNKMKKGEIMVTYMTSPNFLPAMKLASGFVTDEGGLTCHAAIVAREMKKPCVIATKIATKVIKDGDLIEVDANSGIIRIIG